MSITVHCEPMDGSDNRIELPTGEFCYRIWVIHVSGIDMSGYPTIDKTDSGWRQSPEYYAQPWMLVDEVNGVKYGEQTTTYTRSDGGTSTVSISAMDAAAGKMTLTFNHTNLGAKHMIDGYNQQSVTGTQHATEEINPEDIGSGGSIYPIRPVGSNAAKVSIYQNKAAFDTQSATMAEFNILF